MTASIPSEQCNGGCTFITGHMHHGELLTADATCPVHGLEQQQALVTSKNEVGGPPFTVTRYGSLGACVTAERDYMRTLLWEIVGDLTRRASKRDTDGTAVLDLSAGLVQRIDSVLDWQPAPETAAPTCTVRFCYECGSDVRHAVKATGDQT